MKIVEFYPEKQGRPYSPPIIDADGRDFGIPAYSIRGVHLAGEFSKTSKTDNYSAGNEMVILVDASNTDITITLPAAATNSSKVYWIKKIDSSNHSVVIKGNTVEETIDGEEDIALTLQYQYVMVICDGSDWFILGGEYVKMEDILREQKALQEQQLLKLRQIETHLSTVTDEEIKEEDSNVD